jgi:Ran GTPase-activating protein (RanGAP) involved in mRNA processing and transport
LGANRITDVGLAELVRAINPEILVLDLSQNKITQVDKRLLEMIIEPEYKLQEINLANNLLRVASADALFRNVRYSKHLRRLNLSKNKLTPACLDALADMI